MDLMRINWLSTRNECVFLILQLGETESMDFDTATDGEKPLTVWVDTCMQPSGVTLTSLNVSVIVVDSVSCGVMHLFQAGTDMLHIAGEQFERRQRPPEWTYFSQNAL